MSFAYPILAIVAIVSFFAYLAVFASLQRGRKALLSKFAALNLLPALEVNLSKFKVWLKGVCVALAIMFMLLALARPQWGYKWEEQRHVGLDIVFALDTSKSMLAEDIKPNRLERSKLAISDILDRLDGDRVGLVAFSGQAFLQCPVTLDYGAFKMSLEALDTNIIQRGGTNIAAAIDEADAALANTKNQKIIILISDGEELESSGIARAEKISKEQNAKIFTLGVGSTTGEPIPVRDERGNLTFLKDENGKLVSSVLNEDLLKKVAQATGGFYVSLAENGMDEIFENGISKEVKSELSSRMKKVAIERFQIPLAIAMAIIVFELLLGTRRAFAKKLATRSIAPLLAFALLSPNYSKAQATPDPESFFNSGVEAFKAKDLKKAKDDFYASIATSYDLGMQAKAYYNIANANYEEAKALCEKSPSIEEAQGKALEAVKQAEGAISQGNPVLQKAQQTLKTGGEQALKEKSLQDQLKQSVQICEGAKKAIEDNSKSQGELVNSIKNIEAAANLARKNYENAIELDPQFQDAKENLNASNKALEKLNSFEKQFEEIQKAQKKYAQDLQKLIEELKKLIRDENNQNNQNNQNQQNQQNNQNNQNQNNQQNQEQNNNQQNQQDKQNQQNQQDKQNQNSQSQQNNKDNQQDKNQDSSENKQDNKDNQQADKQQQNNPQDQQSQGSQDKKESQEQSEDKADKNPKDENAQNEHTENESDKNGDKDQQQDAGTEPQADQSEQKQDEQATQSGLENQKQSKEEKQGELASKEEQAKQEQKAAAKAAEKADKENQDFRAAEGVMTRREAAQVLDSLKDNEKKLPFSGYGNQRRRYEDRNYKDW